MRDGAWTSGSATDRNYALALVLRFHLDLSSSVERMRESADWSWKSGEPPRAPFQLQDGLTLLLLDRIESARYAESLD